MNRPLPLALLLVASALRLAAQDTPAPICAPKDEPTSEQFSVSVGTTVEPVYLARVSDLTVEGRQACRTPMFEQTALASFASLDVTAPTAVTVTCHDEVQAVKVLPTSAGITPTVVGHKMTFTVAKPGALTLEVNGDWIRSLHLFVNPPEKDVPAPNDPNVIYYGPGVHEVESVAVTSGKTVYLAPGAVVYGKQSPGSPGGPIFLLKGSHMALRGRGIIDGSLCPYHTRSALEIRGSDIRVEGVTIRDSSTWTLPIKVADRVQIDNVKIFGWRGNSDGIDICDSRDVEVSNCFLRTFDDLIVVKAET
jgi:hypothetical protein